MVFAPWLRMRRVEILERGFSHIHIIRDKFNSHSEVRVLGLKLVVYNRQLQPVLASDREEAVNRPEYEGVE